MSEVALFPWRRKTSPPLPSQVARKQQAQEALASTEKVKEEATRQVGFFHELRMGWDRVHQRNNLAQLFDESYGRRPH